MTRRITSLFLGAATLCVVLATCTDAPTSSNHHLSSVALAPRFTKSALSSAALLPAFSLTIDNVRIVLVRPVSDTVKDTVVTVTPDQEVLALNISVDGVVAGDVLTAGIVFRAGDEVLFAGATQV